MGLAEGVTVVVPVDSKVGNSDCSDGSLYGAAEIIMMLLGGGDGALDGIFVG